MSRILQITITVCVASSNLSMATDSSIPHLNVDLVHSMGIDGFGVTVAVLDSGIDHTHPGLVGHIHPGGRSYQGTVLQGDPGVDVLGIGHGTYMSLIIADASGVAPAARILSVRVIGPLGAAVPDVVLGIRYVTMLQMADPSIRVINLSLGSGRYPCQCDTEDPATVLYQSAISDALNVGIVTFAAAGNNAECGSVERPGCVSAANQVAASYDGGYPTQDYGVCADFLPQAFEVVCFSHVAEDCSFFFAAPGFDIRLYEGLGPPLEFDGNGTSQATAHASGVAALLFSKAGCTTLGGPEARSIMFNAADIFKWAFPFCPLTPSPRHINALATVNAAGTGTSPIVGDMNCDAFVDLYDAELFAACMTGPGGGPVQGFCASGDFPSSPPDGDIDLQDFAGFQLAFTGYGSGACCHEDATCTIEEVETCVTEFGTSYHGHGSTCEQVQCPLPDHGACCHISGTSCTEEIHINCGFGDGLYMGDGTLCSSTPCPTVRYRNVVDPLGTFVAAGAGLELADDIILSGVGGGDLAYYDLNVYGGTGGGGLFDVTVGLYDDFPGSGGTLIAGTERTFSDLPDNGSPVFISATFEPPVTIPSEFWMVAEFSNSSAGWFIAGAAETGFTDNLFGRNVPPWDLFWFGGSPYAGLWANVATVEE